MVIFIVTFLIWFAIGLFWLLPQKLALLRRVGNLPNDELIRLAKDGDLEARQLRRHGLWWFGIGLIVLVPQILVVSVLKVLP